MFVMTTPSFADVHSSSLSCMFRVNRILQKGRTQVFGVIGSHFPSGGVVLAVGREPTLRGYRAVTANVVTARSSVFSARSARSWGRSRRARAARPQNFASGTAQVGS